MPEYDDETLIALIKKGDTHAEALFCAKYWTYAKNFGAKFAYSYSDLGLTADDFAAVCFSAVAVAIKKYRPRVDKSFRSYWMAIAKNQCINFVRDSMFSELSVGRPISLDNSSYEDGLSLHETFGDFDYHIKSDINSSQLYDYVLSEKSSLTDDEKIAIYYMCIVGYEYNELIDLTKWSPSKAYRVCSKAKSKVSNFIKSGYFK